MGREIRFRAWDDKEKHFGYFHIGENRIAWPSVNYMTHKVADSFDEVRFKYVTKPWQQFTGLHDKNGNDIWEGDIVNCREYYSNEDIENYIIEDMVDFYLFLNQEFNCFSEEPSELEVLGNIYEHPEILDGK